jgi:hypothetical protein
LLDVVVLHFVELWITECHDVRQMVYNCPQNAVFLQSRQYLVRQLRIRKIGLWLRCERWLSDQNNFELIILEGSPNLARPTEKFGFWVSKMNGRQSSIMEIEQQNRFFPVWR